MNPNETGKAYDQITHFWENPKFNMENGIRQHRIALNFAVNKGNALDVGCGCTGRILNLLKSEGYDVEGIDVSRKKIALARKKLPDIHFEHTDVCQWQPEKSYDFISAWDSIWHIPLESQTSVFEKLVNALNPEGVLIFSFGASDRAEEGVDNAMGVDVYYSTLGVNGFIELLISLGCHCRHLEYDQFPEMHAYLVAQKSG